MFISLFYIMESFNCTRSHTENKEML